jgi:hypothetical protein
MMRFEHRRERVVPVSQFMWRLARSSGIGLALVAASLGVGMVGYRRLFELSWIDAFVNAAMILSGMGPLTAPANAPAKLFAGFYALYSGLAVLAIAGVMFAPVVHRFLHYLHADPDERTPPDRRRPAS